MENGTNNSINVNTNSLSDVKTDMKNEEESANKKLELSTKEKSSLKGLVHLKQSFRTLSVPKKILGKDKNESTRFQGDGVTFKAKLIGILEVEHARGDKMCQEALYELKLAVKAAGEHKQRINIFIAMDGIKLRDEKTNDCLYHHPVHKISFIAQDVIDTRAFGYIFGAPNTGHRFFGIKTDKAANQVVMAMRDLFQAVYELKKKEVELAKQNIEQHQLKYGSSFFLDSLITPSLKNSSDSISKSKVPHREDSKNVKKIYQTAGVIADLMDLEDELNNLQKGLRQMEKLTPSDPFGPSPSLSKEDPFGDSFTPPPCITTPPPAKLPPPPTSGDRRKIGSTSSAASQPELHWFDKETQDLFSNDKNITTNFSTDFDKKKKEESTSICGNPDGKAKDLYDIFTDLDPLGTGRSKPYIDKKDFFQELKNPPKKLLKDLMGNENVEGNNISTCFSGNSKSMFSEESEKLSEDRIRKFDSVDSDHRFNLAEELVKSEPYYETNSDPFETSFANFATFDRQKVNEFHRYSPYLKKSPSSKNEAISQDLDNYSNTTLKSISTTNKSSSVGCVNDSINSKAIKSNWKISTDENAKQKIIINLRKVLSNGDDTDKENDSPVMEETSTLKTLNTLSSARGDASSDSFESIPEPPPRPINSPKYHQPPPLPPKKLQPPMTMKPPPKLLSEVSSHYDYIENYESVSLRRKLSNEVQIPPLPAPVRKPKFIHDSDKDTTSRHRSHHKYPSSITDAEYYLTPISRNIPEKNNKQKSKPSLNITLSQLTNTGFDDLAVMLKIPVSTLSKMTLKELTECLSGLSEAECQQLETNMNINKNRLSMDNKYSSLKESFDEDNISSFKVNFEDKFPMKPTQVDKYAVFRELIEQEEKNLSSNASSIDNPVESNESLPEIKEGVSDDKSSSNENENDKYAALRVIEVQEEESKENENNLKESSEKEDSATEGILPSEEYDQVTESLNLIQQANLEVIDDKFPTPSNESKGSANDQDTTVDMLNKSNNVLEEKENESEDTEVCCEKIENKTSELEVGKNWAKFESELEFKNVWQEERTPDTNDYEEESRGEEIIAKTIKYRKSNAIHKQWNDDDDVNDDDYGDESEENWESSKRSQGSSWDESSWRENGWSDRDSLYDDAEISPSMSYQEQRYIRKRGYHRNFPSRKKLSERSPWEEEESEWQIRNKPSYKEFAKDGDRLYDERKIRTPPRTIDKKRYDYDKEDELILLKMMLGKKRLKALEEQLFKHYHDQLIETQKKPYYGYAKSSSKELPSDDGYADRPKYHTKKYHTQRPRSVDKGRKSQLSMSTHQQQSEDTEELFPEKKYHHRKPYSHDELSISEEERWASRKSPTYRKSRSRNQSQTSPFEDNFSPNRYDYQDVPSEVARSSKSKYSRYNTMKKSNSKKSLDLHPYATYDFKSGRSSRESSQRQSPFEDDFTSSDVQKCERNSDFSKDSIGDRKNDEEEFFTACTTESSSRNFKNNIRTNSRISRYDNLVKRVAGSSGSTTNIDFDQKDTFKEKSNKHYENVEVRRKTPDSLFQDKPSKEKYHKYIVTNDNDNNINVENSKKNKYFGTVECKKHDPFNDNPQNYESRTMPRIPKTKTNSNNKGGKLQNYDSGSDSTETGIKWNGDLTSSSYPFSDQHGRK